MCSSPKEGSPKAGSAACAGISGGTALCCTWRGKLSHGLGQRVCIWLNSTIHDASGVECLCMLCMRSVPCFPGRMALCQGQYPAFLIHAWDSFYRSHSSQNDRPGMLWAVASLTVPGCWGHLTPLPCLPLQMCFPMTSSTSWSLLRMLALHWRSMK